MQEDKSPVIVDAFCDMAKPIRYSSEDVANYNVRNDPDLADSISIHNRLGEEKCGWEFD